MINCIMDSSIELSTFNVGPDRLRANLVLRLIEADGITAELAELSDQTLLNPGAGHLIYVKAEDAEEVQVIIDSMSEPQE